MTVARVATTIESRTNLLFSFEKMALRDAVKSDPGARTFAMGLWDFLHGRGTDHGRFERWITCVGSLPRRQTRVLTWPVVTVMGFLAQPDRHIFLKPKVTRTAAPRTAFRSTTHRVRIGRPIKACWRLRNASGATRKTWGRAT
jgi:hypothetical protein